MCLYSCTSDVDLVSSPCVCGDVSSHPISKMILNHFVFVLVSRGKKFLTGFVVCIKFDSLPRFFRDDTVYYQVLLVLGEFGKY